LLAGVLGADDALEPGAYLGDVEVIDADEDLFDVQPVLGAIEDRLADEQVLGRKDR
jgi:hypothetical protein